MPAIHVCSLARLPEIVTQAGAAHVVTLINSGTPVALPPTVHPDRHVKIFISDIVQTMDGHILAAADHVERLIGYMRAWDRSAPVVIHCWAGVSRSTAAAFASACALLAVRAVLVLAREIRRLSPTATPNARIVALADDMLNRRGRMVDAVAAIGRGEECFEGVPFRLDIGRAA